MSDDVTAARERLRSEPGWYDPNLILSPDGERSRAVLAANDLRTHPADGDEAITEARAATLGYVVRHRHKDIVSMEHDPEHGEYRLNLSQSITDPSLWLFSGVRHEPFTNISQARIRTMGEMYRLHVVLGVPLTEGE